MKISVVFVFLAVVCFGMISAQPVQPVSTILQHQGLSLFVREESEPLEQELQDEPEEEVGTRFRRATCDLLSVSTPFGSLNHAACAGHCLAMRRGFKGGRCRDGICHCRR